uniref:Protein kinase domain-containing protein n=1 Tax=Macrostomum lignano TaxID=282301 RepID=A0A1I8I3A6_9PLAT
FHLAPKQQGVLGLPGLRHGTVGPVNDNVLNLEAQDHCPEQAEGQAAVAIDNIMRAEVLQMDALLSEEAQRFVHILQTVDSHFAFSRPGQAFASQGFQQLQQGLAVAKVNVQIIDLDAVLVQVGVQPLGNTESVSIDRLKPARLSLPKSAVQPAANSLPEKAAKPEEPMDSSPPRATSSGHESNSDAIMITFIINLKDHEHEHNVDVQLQSAEHVLLFGQSVVRIANHVMRIGNQTYNQKQRDQTAIDAVKYPGCHRIQAAPAGEQRELDSALQDEQRDTDANGSGDANGHQDSVARVPPGVSLYGGGGGGGGCKSLAFGSYTLVSMLGREGLDHRLEQRRPLAVRQGLGVQDSPHGTEGSPGKSTAMSQVLANVRHQTTEIDKLLTVRKFCHLPVSASVENHTLDFVWHAEHDGLRLRVDHQADARHNAHQPVQLALGAVDGREQQGEIPSTKSETWTLTELLEQQGDAAHAGLLRAAFKIGYKRVTNDSTTAPACPVQSYCPQPVQEVLLLMLQVSYNQRGPYRCTADAGAPDTAGGAAYLRAQPALKPAFRRLPVGRLPAEVCLPDVCQPTFACGTFASRHLPADVCQRGRLPAEVCLPDVCLPNVCQPTFACRKFASQNLLANIKPMDYSVGEDFYLRGKKNEIVEHSGKLLTSSDLTLKSPVPRVLTRHKSPLNRRHRRFTEGLSGRWLAPPAAPKLGGGGAPTPAEVAAKAAEVAESAGRHPQLLSGGRQKWHRGDDLLPTAGDRWFLGGRGPHLCDEEPFGWPADASGRVWLDRPDSVRHQHAVLHCLSPSSVTTEAARHHLDGVRFDESLLMDAQRQLELERTGPPRDKWAPAHQGQHQGRQHQPGRQHQGRQQGRQHQGASRAPAPGRQHQGRQHQGRQHQGRQHQGRRGSTRASTRGASTRHQARQGRQHQGRQHQGTSTRGTSIRGSIAYLAKRLQTLLHNERASRNSTATINANSPQIGEQQCRCYGFMQRSSCSMQSWSPAKKCSFHFQSALLCVQRGVALQPNVHYPGLLVSATLGS